MAVRDGIATVLLETKPKTGFLTGNAAYRRFDLSELFAKADDINKGLGVGVATWMRISVIGAAGIRAKQGDSAVDAVGTFATLGSGQEVTDSITFHGGLDHSYGLVRTNRYLSILSTDDTVSIILQIMY